MANFCETLTLCFYFLSVECKIMIWIPTYSMSTYHFKKTNKTPKSKKRQTEYPHFGFSLCVFRIFSSKIVHIQHIYFGDAYVYSENGKTIEERPNGDKFIVTVDALTGKTTNYIKI